MVVNVTTGDWILSTHAHQMMCTRGFTRAQVLAAARDPEVAYGDRPTERTHQRADCCVIVNTEKRVIITVLKRAEGRWV